MLPSRRACSSVTSMLGCAEGDASVLIIIAPMHGVLDDAADVRIVEGTVRLVARLEIEDLAVAAGEGAAAAEDFADVAFA